MKYIRKIFFYLIAMLLLTGCKTIPPPNNVEIFPFDLMVNLDDLTNQFEHWGDEFPKIDGAFSYSVSYRNKSENTGAFFSHQITIYPDSKSALDAFSTWCTKWFTEIWIHPEESIYKPKNEDDLFELRCMGVVIDDIPTKSCRLVQSHDNLIILVTTNIIPGNIDFPNFDEVLSKLDARLPYGDIPMPGK